MTTPDQEQCQNADVYEVVVVNHCRIPCVFGQGSEGLFTGCQDVVYGFENLAGQGQDGHEVKGSGHGLPVFGVSAAQLTHEVHFYGYLRTGTLEGIITRAHPLVPIS